jgi:hypothetical protein
MAKGGGGGSAEGEVHPPAPRLPPSLGASAFARPTADTTADTSVGRQWIVGWGRLRIANGKWQMANGKWQMANGKLDTSRWRRDWASRRAYAGRAEPQEWIGRSPSPRPSPPGEGEALAAFVETGAPQGLARLLGGRAATRRTQLRQDWGRGTGGGGVVRTLSPGSPIHPPQ